MPMHAASAFTHATCASSSASCAGGASTHGARGWLQDTLDALQPPPPGPRRLADNIDPFTTPWLSHMPKLPASVAPTAPGWNNTVAVCATMKDENVTDVREWLTYYQCAQSPLAYSASHEVILPCISLWAPSLRGCGTVKQAMSVRRVHAGPCCWRQQHSRQARQTTRQRPAPRRAGRTAWPCLLLVAARCDLLPMLRAASLFSVRVAAGAALLALLCGGSWLALGRSVTDAPHHNPDPRWPSLLLSPGRRWLGVDNVCSAPPVFRFSVADAVLRVAAGGSASTTFS